MWKCEGKGHGIGIGKGVMEEMVGNGQYELQKMQVYKKKIQEILRRLQKKDQENQKLRENNVVLAQEVDRLRRENKKMELQLSGVFQENIQNTKVKTYLEETLKINQNLIKEANSSREKYKKILFEKQKEIEDLHKTISLMKIQVSQKKSDDEQKYNELTELISKQNNVLKRQDEQCQNLMITNSQLENQIEQLKVQLINLNKNIQQNELYIRQMNQNVQKLVSEIYVISKQKQDWKSMKQIEQIRNKMREQAKSEVQKIQSLILKF